MIHGALGVEYIQIDVFHPNGQTQSGNFEIVQATQGKITWM